MKKVFIIIVFLIVFIGNVFSQQKQAITMDVFPMIEGAFEKNFGFGLFFEIKLNNYIATVMEFNVYTNFKKDITYSFIGHGRIYPLDTAINKLFFDMGLGYRRSKWETDNVHCLTGSLTTGWKFILGKGFILEPSIGAWHNLLTLAGETSHNWAPIVGAEIGWAF
jgi:hypothetical protein